MKEMTKNERVMAETTVADCLKAVELIERIHDNCEMLMMKFGWDIGSWDSAKASSIIGSLGLEVACSLGFEDGWFKEVKHEEA